MMANVIITPAGGGLELSVEGVVLPTGNWRPHDSYADVSASERVVLEELFRCYVRSVRGEGGAWYAECTDSDTLRSDIWYAFSKL
jgi:hypothetical protein